MRSARAQTHPLRLQYAATCLPLQPLRHRPVLPLLRAQGLRSPRPRCERRPAPKFQRANGEAQPVSEPKPISHAFYIDKEGMARNKKGDRIMPGDVSDFIVDLRGETGDLDAIVWADDSSGLPRDRSLDVTLG